MKWLLTVLLAVVHIVNCTEENGQQLKGEFQILGSSYRVYTKNGMEPLFLNWTEANAFCENKNSVLAKLDVADLTAVWKEMPDKESGYWTSGSYKNGTYSWGDKTPIKTDQVFYQHEDGSVPSCIKFFKGKLSATFCALKMYPICSAVQLV